MAIFDTSSKDISVIIGIGLANNRGPVRETDFITVDDFNTTENILSFDATTAAEVSATTRGGLIKARRAPEYGVTLNTVYSSAAADQLEFFLIDRGYDVGSFAVVNSNSGDSLIFRNGVMTEFTLPEFGGTAIGSLSMKFIFSQLERNITRLRR